ncbi:dimethylarginine dimethylaminohydrolase family protein [Streptomyces sp. NBC_01497]|uniref:dimethylarginine dimethylaminohydrolase family protein n=1 Tax=Streptomyces sp. NBC_01497 TaxID=2903885 RepID=UPI002E2F794C|nr:arginine deiminase family protein [Streptomyces sp. NBC_01497]
MTEPLLPAPTPAADAGSTNQAPDDGSSAPATYHGPGFRPRVRRHRDEVAEGRLWAPRTVDSEYGRLREVALGIPVRGQRPPAVPDAVQHLRTVDYARMADELACLAGTYEALGVRVHELPQPAGLALGSAEAGTRPPGAGPAPARADTQARPAVVAADDRSTHNRMFARDTFVMTPEGAVLARMGSEVRAGESRLVARLLASLDIPVIRTIHGSGTLEGADVLWAGPDVALVGVGNRTNEEGARQLTETLATFGARTVPVRMPRGVQHLLGLVQFLDHDLAVIRHELADTAMAELLRRLGHTLLPLAEHPDITDGFGMNVVCVAPRTVVMPTGAAHVRKVFDAAGVDVAAEVAIGELLAAAGGIGCATGILSRDRATLPHPDPSPAD